MRNRLLLIFCTTIVWTSQADASEEFAKARDIIFDRTKGNCLACHAIADGDSPGNIGPELSNIKNRYPDPSVLRARIRDETVFNPQTVMPPFGRHGILNDAEIDLVVDYLYTL